MSLMRLLLRRKDCSMGFVEFFACDCCQTQKEPQRVSGSSNRLPDNWYKLTLMTRGAPDTVGVFCSPNCVKTYTEQWKSRERAK